MCDPHPIFLPVILLHCYQTPQIFAVPFAGKAAGQVEGRDHRDASKLLYRAITLGPKIRLSCPDCRAFDAAFRFLPGIHPHSENTQLLEGKSENILYPIQNHEVPQFTPAFG